MRLTFDQITIHASNNKKPLKMNILKQKRKTIDIDITNNSSFNQS